MNAPALAVRQFSYENKSFWRNPAAAFFTFVFPLLFLIIFTAIFSGDVDLPNGTTINSATYYTAAILAFGVISATYTNIAISVTFIREEGVLKRVRGTPIPATSYLIGKVLHAIFVQVLLVIITLVFGKVFYDVAIPGETMPAFIATLIIGAACFCTLGLAVTAIIPNQDAAPPVVNASVLPLLFLSGVFIPTTTAPPWMTNTAEVFPIKHFLDGLFSSYLQLTSTGWEGRDMLIVVAWAVVGLVLAARFFRWEPRR
ncbi:MAG: ABC transporter permease [Gaiellales bacterium]